MSPRRAVAAILAQVPAGELAVDLIDANPANPRRAAIADDMMIESIRAVGVIEPVVVRAVGERFELLAGHRRLDGARKAGLMSVPHVVREADDAQAMEVMLIENLARQDLSPLEEAEGLRALVDLGRSQREVAKMIGVSQTHVSHRISLLKLPELVQAWVDAGLLGIKEGIELAKVPTEVVEEWRQRQGSWDDQVPQEFAVRNFVEAYEAGQARRKRRAQLEKLGIKVLDDRPGYKTWEPPVALDYLHWVGLDVHRELDCHAIWVDTRGDDVPACTTPDNHPAPEAPKPAGDTTGVGAQPRATLAQTRQETLPDPAWRKEREARNQMHDAANADRARRRKWAKNHLAATKFRNASGVLGLAAWAVINMNDCNTNGVAELLGLGADLDWEEALAAIEQWIGDDPIERPTAVLLANALDMQRDRLYGFNQVWEEDYPLTIVYLGYLQANGYDLSELEAAALAQASTVADESGTDESEEDEQ